MWQISSGALHFANQPWLSSQKTPAWLNIWQPVIKERYKESVAQATFRRYPGSDQYVSVGVLVNTMWFDFNIRGYFLYHRLAHLLWYLHPSRYSRRRRMLIRGSGTLPAYLFSIFNVGLVNFFIGTYLISSVPQGFSSYKLQKLICITHFTHCKTLSINTGPMCSVRDGKLLGTVAHSSL